MPVTHGVKSWPEFYWPIIEGSRKHELRENDRDYQIGDLLYLNEFDPETNDYTGRATCVRITSIISAEKPCAVSKRGLMPGFVILSIDFLE